MAERYIYESLVLRPTLDYIERVAPPEFLPAYEWFQVNQNAHISALPHRLPEPMRVGGIPLSRDSGIYSPTKKLVDYHEGKRYALSVHSDGNGNYPDRPPIPLGDGTWILDYSEHAPTASAPVGQDYNGYLMNCLEDGLPVGVMVKVPGGGYAVKGLALVERYNAVAKMFTLHGPVNVETVAKGRFDLPDIGSSKGIAAAIESLDFADERKIALVEQVQREHQGKFRETLLKAYGGQCAITHTDVPEVLQAAHINPYRGRKAQVACNGLLLRADMHLLYDAHLVSVDPDTLQLRVSEGLERSIYARYSKAPIALPSTTDERPNCNLLEVHYTQFQLENAIME